MRRVTGSASVFEGLLIDWVVTTPVSPRLPVGLLSREQKAAELVRVQAEKAMRAAYEAELILGLADDTLAVLISLHFSSGQVPAPAAAGGPPQAASGDAGTSLVL